MLLLIAGIIVFFVPHSIRIFAEDGRSRLVRRLGENGYKGFYSILSFIGIMLIGYGYARARLDTPVLWTPPMGLRHLALVIVPVSLAAVIAAYTPAGHLKSALRHPMVVGVGLWAFAHLLANGTLADVLLFGSFLVWAVADFAVAVRRNPRPAGATKRWSRGDTVAVGGAALATVALLGGLHQWLFGVSPLV